MRHSVLRISLWWFEWWFLWREENRKTWGKNPESKARTNTKLNPHMALCQNKSQVILVGGESLSMLPKVDVAEKPAHSFIVQCKICGDLEYKKPTFLIYALRQKMPGVWVWVEGCSLHVCDPPCSHGPLLYATVSTIPVESLYKGRQVSSLVHLTWRRYLGRRVADGRYED